MHCVFTKLYMYVNRSTFFALKMEAMPTQQYSCHNSVTNGESVVVILLSLPEALANGGYWTVGVVNSSLFLSVLSDLCVWCV